MPDAPVPISLALHIFGPFEVFVNGKRLPPPRSQAGQWILAWLALHQDRPVERVWLASLLWPDSSHEQALYNLRRNLTDLRQLLGGEADRLTTPTPRTLHLNLDGARCDVLEFDAAIQKGMGYEGGGMSKAGDRGQGTGNSENPSASCLIPHTSCLMPHT